MVVCVREGAPGRSRCPTVIDADLSPGLAAELPAVMHAARLGDMQPLLRMFALDAAGSASTPEDLSGGLFAATICTDGPVPWPADTPQPDALFNHDGAHRTQHEGSGLRERGRHPTGNKLDRDQHERPGNHRT